MQSEVNQEENLNRIITVPNLLSFFRLCLIPVIIWSYCVKKNPLLAGEILLLSVYSFPHVLLLIVIMAGKELYMVVSGCLVIRKTGKVHGADWHGKIVTFLLYA